MKHIWQSANNCGPAAVVMALSTFGVELIRRTRAWRLRGRRATRHGPAGVGPWVKDNWDPPLDLAERGTKRPDEASHRHGFVPMVTQWSRSP